MDSSSLCVAEFLNSLQDAMTMLGEIRNHYQRLGTRPQRPYFVLSGRPFRIHETDAVRQFDGCLALGLHVKGVTDACYELGVDLLWDTDNWTVTTEAWGDSEAQGQELLRELPERRAGTLEECATQVKAAIYDLRKFADLIPRENK